MEKIKVLDTSVSFYTKEAEDYICITDIARFRDSDRTDYIIQNWLRNRNTIEFLGIWETLNNPDFKPIEFDGFKRQSGLNSFVLTAKEWRESNPDSKGNIRDQATLEQLVVLANLESINSVFIRQGLPQNERLIKLNEIAIIQMKSLITNTNIKRLK